MYKLSPNWITEKHIDFEYKKYLLLAYLQGVNKEFEQVKLYPSLSELVMHYRNVKGIRENKQNIQEKFEHKLIGFDFNQFKLVYEKCFNDDALILELEQIIDFSIPRFEKLIQEGKKIYELIESSLSVSPVGIVPLSTMEGYLFLKYKKTRETYIYNYQVSLIEQPDDTYRAINTRYLGTYDKSASSTFESIKREVIAKDQTLPNPATYVIESDMQLQREETFLPIAKRLMIRYIAH